MNNFLAVIAFIVTSTLSYSQEYKDCADAYVLCGESPFTIAVTEGIGMEDSGVTGSCVIEEFASTWIALNAITDGDIIFEITPTEEDTDLDFAVFKVESNDCESKTIVRCMASGENAGAPAGSNEPCTGSTGLAYGETDTVEQAGCSAGDNNFLAPIVAQAGDNFVLMINNFSQGEESLQLELGGTAQLDCITVSTENTNKEENPLFNVSQEGNQIIVETKTLDGSGTLRMYNINGAAVREINIHDNEVISIEKLMPRGTYFLILNTAKGTYSQKTIVVY